ncbi:MAG TPA: GNAT family N-acetyltransferase [Bacteroidales bacterium]|nr:GNAT family N-acetyltransferase [Bacteroidales bacterium]
MEPIPPATPVEEIMKELSRVTLLRKTNNGNNEVYLFNSHTSPILMNEVGRIRELTFRHAGGGTGKSIDVDEYDMSEEHPQKQLIVWDPDNREIVGGYRFIHRERHEHNFTVDRFASSSYFTFSRKFRYLYLRHTMELGRSFVRPEYQTGAMGRKSLFALDNLWDGLGAIVIDNPQVRYLFGKVTMYTHFNVDARNMILYFMKKHFTDKDGIAVPADPINIDIHEDDMKRIFTGKNFKDDYKILSQEVRKLGENVPPLIHAYMSLSPTMKCFGTFINHHFGDVEETGIMITVRDMYIEKVNRHLASYDEGYDLNKDFDDVH